MTDYLKNRMRYIKEFTPTISEKTAKMITFRFGWDYIVVAYHQDGFISITSSYGNWSYIWSAMGERDLPEFFTKANKEYLANKLFGPGQKEFNGQIAIKNIKEAILRDRKWDILSSQEARDFYELTGELPDTNSRDLFWSTYYDLGLDNFDPEPYEHNWGEQYNMTYLILQERIIPMIQDYFHRQKKSISGVS
jgi:hypothetical protein